MKDGIIIVNKPSGITSHKVVSHTRYALQTKKVGHGGTLDPMARGVLIILVGRGTKLSDILLCEDKGYIAEITLGIQTDTLDTTGTIINTAEVAVTPAQIENTLSKFRGTIEQTPPMYSAIKQDGKKLYELARKGISVERKTRTVHIKKLKMIDDNLNNHKFTIEVACSKGTYIRSLIDDIGKELGCFAVMSDLVRTKSGRFKIEDAIELEDVSEDKIMTIDEIFPDIPVVTVMGKSEMLIKNGNAIETDFKDCDRVKVFAKNELICLANVNNGILRPSIMLYTREDE